jgi:hypothetical protein
MLLGITLYSLAFMSFHVVCHEKVFNEAICTQDYVYLLICSIRVFIREIIKTYIMLIVFLLICLIGLQEFFSAYMINYLHFFHKVFE